MIHHMAIAPKDFNRSHRFYTEVMGFKMVKAVKRQAMGGAGRGWTKHVFYDTGDGSLLALWDLHLTGLREDEWKSAISVGLGLPWWINHFAFDVDSLEALEAHKQTWLSHGLKVSEVDHEFIRSIYARDPDDNLIEFTYQTRPLTQEDVFEAEYILADDTPATIPEYDGQVFYPEERSDRAAVA